MLTKSASSSGDMLDASSSPRSSIADGEHNEGVGSRPQDAEETIAREEDQLDLVLYPDESCPSFKVELSEMKKEGYERRSLGAKSEEWSRGAACEGEHSGRPAVDTMEAMAEAELARARQMRAMLDQREKEGWTTAFAADPSSVDGETTTEPVEAFSLDEEFDYDNVELEHNKSMVVKFA